MTAPRPIHTLASTDWLAAHLSDVRVIDASWYMPGDRRDARAEYAAAHIPGAVFFDLEACSDTASDLPHTMPPPESFAAAMAELGVGDDRMVVVYDGSGLFSAPRLWWMLRAMGHDRVMVLDGGLPKWRAEGRPLARGASDAAPAGTPAAFTARPDGALIRDFAGVKARLGDSQILDARSASRFSGAEPEPRPGLRGGHMPGAVNLPHRSLIHPDGTLKDDAALRALFAEKGVDLRAPIITSCGSGVSAAILMLALARLGAADTALYDGSWTEWGSRADAPVVTG